MSDDTRQARISAAMVALFQGERGDVALGYYVIRSRMDAALADADAIGRERVSEAEAIWLVDSFASTIRLHLQSAVDEMDVSDDEASPEHRELTDRYRQQRARIISLLAAAPAERGHDETGEKP